MLRVPLGDRSPILTSLARPFPTGTSPDAAPRRPCYPVPAMDGPALLPSHPYAAFLENNDRAGLTL